MLEMRTDRGVRPGPWSAARQALLSTEASAPTLLVVRGPTGSGKTRFLADLASLAAARGLRVAAVETADAAIPMLAMDRLTRELGTRTENVVSDLDRLHRLRTACQRASAGRPGVMVIVDHADVLSAPDRSALVDLALNPPCANLLITIAFDSAAARTAGGTEGRWASLDDARIRARRIEVELTPLTGDEVTALAESRFGIGAVATRFGESVARACGGLMERVNALLEMVATLDDEEQRLVLSGSELIEPTVVWGPPLRYLALTPAIEDPETLRIARALAAWITPATVTQIAGVLEMEPQAVEQGLAWLEDRGIVTAGGRDRRSEFEFAIPLTRLQILRETPELIRRQLHARIASIKEDLPHPTDTITLAQHYIAGRVAMTRGRLLLVNAAAESLTSRSRYARAQRLLSDAVSRFREEHPDEDVPREVLTLLAETLSRSGAWDEAERLLAADPSDTRSGEPTIRRARDLVAQGRDNEASDLLAGELASETLAPQDRLAVMLDLARLFLQGGRLRECEELSAQASTEALAQGDTRAAVENELTLHARFLNDGLPRTALEYARRALVLAHGDTDERLQARALSGVGNALTDSVGLHRAFRWLQRARERAEAAEDFATLSWTTQLLAVNSIERGDWAAADHLTSAAARIDSVLHRSRSLLMSTAIRNWLQALAGERPESLEYPEMTDFARGAGRTETFALQAACEGWLLAGEPDRAREPTSRLVSALEARPGNRRQLVGYALPAQAAVAFELQDPDLLLTTVARLRGLLADVAGEHALVRPQLNLAEAMLHYVREEWTPASDRARLACEEFERYGYRLRAAVARQLAGDACREAGDVDRSYRLLTEAFTAYRMMRATPRMDAVRESLHLLGRRAPRDQVRSRGLTSRQWEIAALVAQGKSDREVAASLGIRHRTVTTHMSNILRALQLRTRRELGEWVQAREAERRLGVS